MPHTRSLGTDADRIAGWFATVVEVGPIGDGDVPVSKAIDVSQLVSNLGDAVVVSDAAGLIVLWNASAERIFGFSQAEALGRSLDLITPDRHRQRHWDGYRTTMASGRTRYGSELLRVPALHKDGRALSIAFTVGLLFDADGAVTGIAAVIRDETARWNAEREMRRRIAELEAAALVPAG